MKKIILLMSIGLISVSTLAAPAKKRGLAGKTTAAPVVAAPVVASAAPESTVISTPHRGGGKFVFEENKSEVFLSATQAEFRSGNGDSNLMVSGVYTYLIQPQIQVGGEVTLGSSSFKGGGSYTRTDIYGLGMYNFQPTINESIFAFAGLGIATAPTTSKNGTTTTESKVGFKTGAGKRFPLWAKIQYVPTASIEKLGDQDPIIRIVPINFSLIF